jgi:plastocyanin
MALALLWAAGSAGAESGTVGGTVRLELEGPRLADVGPTVVFLEPVAAAVSFRPPRSVPQVHQKNARFDPSFLTVTVGQSVAMPNDDAIFHNVFSYSRPNDFDLGLYPAGESRQVTFQHAGLVRVYCSIHETMSALIWVAPSPWFATADAAGDFEIRGVPPGRYRARTWNEKLPEVAADVTVRAGGRARLDLAIGTSD